VGDERGRDHAVTDHVAHERGGGVQLRQAFQHVLMFRGTGPEATFAHRKVRPGETSVELGAEELEGIGGGRWKLRDQSVEKIINGCFDDCHVLPRARATIFVGRSTARNEF
jgi:hypothetical protein